MTLTNRYRVAAVLALVLGLLTIGEGGAVLVGIETKHYPVLPWLLRYNVLMGFVSLAAGHGLWRERTWSVTLSRTILGCHALVLLLLLGLRILGRTVAVESIGAMVMRTAVWTGITFLVRVKQGERKG